MGQRAWEPGFSELVAALLQLHEDRIQRRGMQRGKRVSRPTVLLGLLRLAPPFRGLFKDSHSYFSQERASRLYQDLADKDMVAALLELNTIEHQLSLLDDRRALRRHPDEGTRHLASPQELEMVARALLLYYLQGQSTDDPLLEKTQTVFREVWRAENERAAMIMESPRRNAAASSAKETAALDRYYVYWDQWLGERLGKQTQ